MFNQKTILITGGTGSFGKACVKQLLKNFNPKAIRIYSRDELKQWEMTNQFSSYKNSQRLRFLLGDVRDKERLNRAVENCDYIIHAAALKQIPAAEYNPMECIKTNIMGAQNVIDCALDSSVKKVIALSSDKAAAPTNLYGASKLCAEKLFIAANNMRGVHNIKFSVVRYGNVMGSRGSVVPLFLESRRGRFITITHPEMTRFNFTLEEAIDLVFYALKNQWGGEVYVPKIPSYKITDLAKALAPKTKIKIIGIRPGEKLHEEMITVNESHNTVELDKYYAVLPTSKEIGWTHKEFIKKMKAKIVKVGFNYCSKNNKEWLTVEAIRQLIKKHVDPDFKIV